MKQKLPLAEPQRQGLLESRRSDLETHPSPPSRRHVLRRGAVVIGAGAVIGAAGVCSGALAATKIPKNQAGYSDKPRGGNECDKCLQFQPPMGCDIVDGPVSPKGSCNFFGAKPH